MESGANARGKPPKKTQDEQYCEPRSRCCNCECWLVPIGEMNTVCTEQPRCYDGGFRAPASWLGHLRAVVLAPMELQRLLLHVRLQGIQSIRRILKHNGGVHNNGRAPAGRASSPARGGDQTVLGGYSERHGRRIAGLPHKCTYVKVAMRLLGVLNQMREEPWAVGDFGVMLTG